MKNTYLNSKCRPVLALALIFVLMLNACKEPELTLTTTEDVNLTGYLDKNADKFSLFSDIIERSGSEGYLSAYGKYTLFTPTNEAVTEWLKSINKASVNDLTPEELKKVVNYHLIMDTLSTKTFTDGKIPQLTLYGQYLSTGVVTNQEGKSSYVVNKNTKIIQSNIRTGNGIIQVVDKVLVPFSKTLAQQIAENPRYSIFTQALKETGFYDSLNVDPAQASNSSRQFLTLIAESDSALNKAGFADYNALKAKMSTTGVPSNPADSLYLYVAYHITPQANYVADIISASSLSTLAPSEVISTKFAGRTVFLNEVEFNGQIEPGAEINRGLSDVAASNGVLHDAKSFFKIKVRVPTPLYWDVDIEGIRAHPNYGKVQIDLGSGALLTSISPGSYRAERYVGGQVSMYTVGQLSSSRSANKNDWYRLAMSFNGGARPMWQEFRTPLLVKGLYKVWICYPNQTTSGTSQWIINPGTPVEQVLPTIFENGHGLNNSGQSLTAPNSDALLEGAGFKRYIALNTETAVDANGNTITGDVSPTHTGNVGRLAGIANIRTTDRHWIRVRQVTGANGGNETQLRHAVNLDMIHFIPINMDQQYPRFSRSGTVFKRP